MNEYCANPEMRTLKYFPCKVCKSDDDTIVVPEADFDPQNGEILSIECKKIEEVHADMLKYLGIKNSNQLENCEATIFENKQILCYRCSEDYFYDGAHKICRPIEQFPALKGCSLSFDMNHCIFCDSEFQMDVTTGSCVEKDFKINTTKFDNEKSPGQGDGGELSVNSHKIASDNNVFVSGNDMTDESGADSYGADEDNRKLRYL